MNASDTVSAGRVFTLMAQMRPRRHESDPRWVVDAEHAKPSDPLPMYVTVTWPDPDVAYTDEPVPTVVTLVTLADGGVAWTVDGGAWGDGIADDLATAVRDALAVVDTVGVALERAA